jgi:hypothetical protein
MPKLRADGALEQRHALGRARHGDAAALLPAGGKTGLGARFARSWPTSPAARGEHDHVGAPQRLQPAMPPPAMTTCA